MTFIHRLRDAFAHAKFTNLMADFASLEKRVVSTVDRLHASRRAHQDAVLSHEVAIDAVNEKLDQSNTLLSNLRKFVTEKL
jgi:hypothetical protein